MKSLGLKKEGRLCALRGQDTKSKILTKVSVSHDKAGAVIEGNSGLGIV